MPSCTWQNYIKNKNFVNKIFSTKEKDIAKNKRLNKTNYFAKRFAAKEAFLKAIGTGLSKGFKFNDITIIGLTKKMVLLIYGSMKKKFTTIKVKQLENYSKEKKMEEK